MPRATRLSQRLSELRGGGSAPTTLHRRSLQPAQVALGSRLSRPDAVRAKMELGRRVHRWASIMNAGRRGALRADRGSRIYSAFRSALRN